MLGDRQSAADALFIENLVSIDYDGKIYGVFFQLPVENQMIPSVSSGSDFRKFEAAGVVGGSLAFGDERNAVRPSAEVKEGLAFGRNFGVAQSDPGGVFGIDLEPGCLDPAADGTGSGIKKLCVDINTVNGSHFSWGVVGIGVTDPLVKHHMGKFHSLLSPDLQRARILFGNDDDFTVFKCFFSFE